MAATLWEERGRRSPSWRSIVCRQMTIILIDTQLGRVTSAYDTYQSTADSEMVLSCKVSTERGGHHLQCGGGQIVLRKEAVDQDMMCVTVGVWKGEGGGGEV